MWIEVRLPPDSVASRLVIYYNLRRNDRPRAMRLRAWDGNDWTTILDAIPRNLDEFEFLNGRPVYGSEVKTLRFPPMPAGRLRLEILEEEPKREWTIGEIRLFGPEPPRGVSRVNLTAGG